MQFYNNVAQRRQNWGINGFGRFFDPRGSRGRIAVFDVLMAVIVCGAVACAIAGWAMLILPTPLP
jgi:hypothetical protein